MSRFLPRSVLSTPTASLPSFTHHQPTCRRRQLDPPATLCSWRSGLILSAVPPRPEASQAVDRACCTAFPRQSQCHGTCCRLGMPGCWQVAATERVPRRRMLSRNHSRQNRYSRCWHCGLWPASALSVHLTNGWSFVAIGVLWTDRAVGCAHLHHACLTVSEAGCWHAHCARVAVSSRAIADTHAYV